ncbi:unnamed protein product [Brassica oleracea]
MMKLITSGPLHTMPWSGKAMCWLVNTQRQSMAIRVPRVLQSSKQILRQAKLFSSSSSSSIDVPKGYLAVYVGERKMKRFVVPISYLKEPSFQDLLRRAEEEYGYDHPMGGLTIPCSEETFINLASRLN